MKIKNSILFFTFFIFTFCKCYPENPTVRNFRIVQIPEEQSILEVDFLQQKIIVNILRALRKFNAIEKSDFQKASLVFEIRLTDFTSTEAQIKASFNF